MYLRDSLTKLAKTEENNQFSALQPNHKNG